MRLRKGRRANLLGGIAPISSPSNMITPSVLSMRRMIMVDVVDFPQPDSPTRPTLSPRPIEKLMPSTARKVSGWRAAKNLCNRSADALARILLHELLDQQQRTIALASVGRRRRRRDRRSDD